MTMAPWLAPLPDAAAMRATDAWAIETRGIPSLTLMERAGAGLARAVAARAPSGRIAIVCGRGNNGGDGLVAARLLRGEGREVEALLVGDPGELRGDAAAQLAQLPGAPPAPFAAERLPGAALIVDALLGTGAGGAPREPAASAIAAMDAAAAPVVAADVPSGVDASTGEAPGPAVHAVATVTFHQAKPGLWVHPGKAHAGEVEVVDIGIPDGAPVAPAAGLIQPGVLAGIPRRGAGSTKFTSGAVVVAGGASGLTGAPTMAALAAQRTGAGYVTVLAPASTELAFAVRLLEAMFRGLPEADGALAPAALEPALAALARADAVVLGPGLSKHEGAQALARELVRRAEAPLVVDADGLNALAGRLAETVAVRSAPTVLTPHAGELGRLLGRPSAEVDAHRLASAREAAASTGAVVVLKGDDTIVAEPGGEVAISPGGAPALATAGTGDVLAGVIGALLAKGLPAPHAAAAGVFAHLRAGRLAAAPHGPDPVVASDVIAALPAALSS